MTAKNRILIALSSLLLIACGRGTLYSDFQSVDMTGWNMDSIVTFTVPVTDTIHPYNVILHVRHTDGYPYQNMWLFVNDGQKIDTIEFFLASDRGQWLGNGRSIIDMPVLYREQLTFRDSIYTIQVQQAMRDVVLKGVSDIGVEVVRL